MNYESDKYRIATYEVPASQSFINVDETQVYLIQHFVGDIASFVPNPSNNGYIYAVWESIIPPGLQNILNVYGFSISMFDINGNAMNWPNTLDNLRIWDASKLTWINVGQCIAIAAPTNFKNYYVASTGVTFGPYILDSTGYIQNMTYSFPYGTPGVNTILVVVTNNTPFVRSKGFLSRNTKIEWDFGEDYLVQEGGNYAINVNLFVALNGFNVNGNTGIGDCGIYINDQLIVIQYWCLENIVQKGSNKFIQCNLSLFKNLNLSDTISVKFNCETGAFGTTFNNYNFKPTCFGEIVNPSDVFAKLGILPQANTFQIVQIDEN
jgi:hypothetical protein